MIKFLLYLFVTFIYLSHANNGSLSRLSQDITASSQGNDMKTTSASISLHKTGDDVDTNTKYMIDLILLIDNYGFIPQFQLQLSEHFNDQAHLVVNNNINNDENFNVNTSDGLLFTIGAKHPNLQLPIHVLLKPDVSIEDGEASITLIAPNDITQTVFFPKLVATTLSPSFFISSPKYAPVEKEAAYPISSAIGPVGGKIHFEVSYELDTAGNFYPQNGYLVIDISYLINVDLISDTLGFFALVDCLNIPNFEGANRRGKCLMAHLEDYTAYEMSLRNLVELQLDNYLYKFYSTPFEIKLHALIDFYPNTNFVPSPLPVNFSKLKYGQITSTMTFDLHLLKLDIKAEQSYPMSLSFPFAVKFVRGIDCGLVKVGEGGSVTFAVIKDKNCLLQLEKKNNDITYDFQYLLDIDVPNDDGLSHTVITRPPLTILPYYSRTETTTDSQYISRLNIKLTEMKVGEYIVVNSVTPDHPVVNFNTDYCAEKMVRTQGPDNSTILTLEKASYDPVQCGIPFEFISQSAESQDTVSLKVEKFGVDNVSQGAITNISHLPIYAIKVTIKLINKDPNETTLTPEELEEILGVVVDNMNKDGSKLESDNTINPFPNGGGVDVIIVPKEKDVNIGDIVIDGEGITDDLIDLGYKDVNVKQGESVVNDSCALHCGTPGCPKCRPGFMCENDSTCIFGKCVEDVCSQPEKPDPKPECPDGSEGPDCPKEPECPGDPDCPKEPECPGDPDCPKEPDDNDNSGIAFKTSFGISLSLFCILFNMMN